MAWLAVLKIQLNISGQHLAKSSGNQTAHALTTLVDARLRHEGNYNGKIICDRGFCGLLLFLEVIVLFYSNLTNLTFNWS